MEAWFSSASGRCVDLRKPTPEIVHWSDISAALSKICRFNGHCPEFYSVAQHSVLAARMAPAHLKFAALMHDAHEAYVQDIISPLKHVISESYATLDRAWEYVVREKFDIKLTDAQWFAIKALDRRMLATEHRDLVRDGRLWSITEGFPPFDDLKIVPWDWREARTEFENEFAKLYRRGKTP